MKKPKVDSFTERAGLIVSVLVLILSLLALAGYRSRDLALEREHSRLRNAANLEEVPGTGKREAAASSSRNPEGEADPLLQRAPEFRRLLRIHPGIVAWLTVPGAGVDLPVCRYSDDVYYLTHGADGRKSFAGSLFFPAGNDPEDARVIIYGHNMRSGSMFGRLKRYRKESTAREYPYLYLYTPEMTIKAEIFSCFEADASDALFTPEADPVHTDSGSEDNGRDPSDRGDSHRDSSDGDAHGAWLHSLQERSLYRTPVEVSGGERCITLSTCVGGGRSGVRLTVHAVVRETVKREQRR